VTGRHVLIIGAGPAGLTAAHELLSSDAPVRVTVVEADAQVGGISKTVVYKGNRMDIGGHRFFSKSDWVTRWWLSVLPPADDADAGADAGRVMLERGRLSRIFFEGHFFPYPLRPDLATARKLGVARMARILVSYARARLRPRRPERSLEDFLVNRFGTELYRTFFADYTEKVWGVACRDLSPDWGAQRIKGLSIGRAVRHMLLAPIRRLTRRHATETSLIERFLYPRLGPGQMWETVAESVRAAGGAVHLSTRAVGIARAPDGAIAAVLTRDAAGAETRHAVDAVISTMPVVDLIRAMDPPPPEPVRAVADGLAYRDFLTVGLLAERMAPERTGSSGARVLPDTWIYVQDPRFRVGRLQIFNNWSPDLVADPDTAWIGMEYFCAEGDALWSMPDADLIRLAADEIIGMGLVRRADVRDGHVVRVPKAYPGYFGTYDRFAEIRAFTDTVPNLYLVGRNGMHRYNNQDHSMLTAALAAKAILNDNRDKEKIWDVNIDDSYHEEK
jgi:protoporphyrinogen oxidase